MLLGAHESTSGGLHEAFTRALADGAEAVQIFTKSSRMWRAKEITSEDARVFRARNAETALPCAVHASYLVNLGSPPGDLREKSIAAFTDELARADLLGIPSLVVHPGANADSKQGLGNVAEALDRVFAAHKGRCRVLLETAAGQGSCLGSRFEELRTIRDLCRSPERVAVSRTPRLSREVALVAAVDRVDAGRDPDGDAAEHAEAGRADGPARDRAAGSASSDGPGQDRAGLGRRERRA